MKALIAFVFCLLCFSAPATAERALVVMRVEVYRCVNPISYKSIEMAARVSYQAAHEAAEAMLQHGCEKTVRYYDRSSTLYAQVSFVGVVKRSYLEVQFFSLALVRRV